MAGMLCWLLLSLACNYPAARRQPPGLSKEALRQTLEALPEATAKIEAPAPAPTGTIPAPASPLLGLRTATPGDPQPDSPLVFPLEGEVEPFLYFAQPGDTLPALALRFGVSPEQIASAEEIPTEAFISPGQLLSIPNILGEIRYPSAVLPDSEVIYSPSTLDFQVHEYASLAGGYLSTYQEMVDGELVSGAEIIQRIALESSTNPRLLLAFLEYRSQWVRGQPESSQKRSHPIGFYVPNYQGLFRELSLTVNQLNIAYYGWRSGTFTELKFQDGTLARLSPDLNAGSVAVQHLLAKFYKQGDWLEALYGQAGFLALYTEMFGDAWGRAAQVEPLFPDGLEQPELELPFQSGERWSLTGGPHTSWMTGTPRGALDFAPVTGEAACVVSRAWVTASAAGVLTRSDRNIVALDLDGDGFEQTGWVLFYLHIADRERVPAETRVNLDDPLGHPSCERGRSTGTHVHIARKYNGEWIAADGPLPFVMSGWRARNGARLYEGSLIKGEQEVWANPGGPRTSIVVR